VFYTQQPNNHFHIHGNNGNSEYHQRIPPAIRPSAMSRTLDCCSAKVKNIVIIIMLFGFDENKFTSNYLHAITAYMVWQLKTSPRGLVSV
jgi:hypothetical protein